MKWVQAASGWATIIGHFEFVFQEKMREGNRIISEVVVFKNLRFQKFPVHTIIRNASVLEFPRCTERFQNSPFSWRISADGRPNRRNKASFTWLISVAGRPNRRNKASFAWQISVDGRPNRRK